jgi:ABC-type Fe3+-hydroxamate transport system substrate-binding protein
VVLSIILLSFFALMFAAKGAEGSGGGMKSPPPEKIDVAIIGDRVVDIAYNLGVVPAAMSVRGSLWPLSKKLMTASQMLGCPRCITLKKQILPEACEALHIKRLIIEKSDPYCIYKPEVKPENIVPLMAGKNLSIDYVDFSDGLDSAVRQTAALVGRENQADAVIAKYHKAMDAVATKLPERKSGKRVVIFNGIYQASTGKLILRVEAPGGYADRFLLKKLGCINAGETFKPADGKPNKGHYPVPKKKSGMVLDSLIAADPDAIVMTGDAFAVQKALADYQAAHPELGRVKAIRNMAVYALPGYVDSSVLEYPGILRKWATALVP